MKIRTGWDRIFFCLTLTVACVGGWITVSADGAAAALEEEPCLACHRPHELPPGPLLKWPDRIRADYSPFRTDCPGLNLIRRQRRLTEARLDKLAKAPAGPEPSGRALTRELDLTTARYQELLRRPVRSGGRFAQQADRLYREMGARLIQPLYQQTLSRRNGLAEGTGFTLLLLLGLGWVHRTWRLRSERKKSKEHWSLAGQMVFPLQRPRAAGSIELIRDKKGRGH